MILEIRSVLEQQLQRKMNRIFQKYISIRHCIRRIWKDIFRAQEMY